MTARLSQGMCAHSAGRLSLSMFFIELAKGEQALHSLVATAEAAAQELHRRERKTAHLRHAIAELRAYMTENDGG